MGTKYEERKVEHSLCNISAQSSLRLHIDGARRGEALRLLRRLAASSGDQYPSYHAWVYRILRRYSHTSRPFHPPHRFYCFSPNGGGLFSSSRQPRLLVCAYAKSRRTSAPALSYLPLLRLWWRRQVEYGQCYPPQSTGCALNCSKN